MNVSSILQYGILSHTRAEKIDHQSVAMNEILERRQNKQIPGARKLYDYANLYFDAHNPMLSRLRDKNDNICVFRISSKVLDLPGVIISDCNAASDKVRFFPVADGLRALDKNRIFARSWKHRDDFMEELRHKSEKCAEVLVPDSVGPSYTTGAIVANQKALTTFQKLNILLTVCIWSDVFF
jgi:hypothetical protein